MNLSSITEQILPDESKPEEMRLWRVRIAAVACSNWLFTFLLLVPFLVAVLFVGMPLIGQVAWAKDQTQQVAALEQKVEATDSKVDTLLKLGYEARMRELRDEICATTAVGTRRVLEDAMSDIQDDYRKLTGNEYRVGSRC